MIGNFKIIQDSKTKRSWMVIIDNGETKITQCPEKDFPYLRLLASLIRNSENPTELMDYVRDHIENNND